MPRRSILTRPTPSCRNSSFPVWGTLRWANDRERSQRPFSAARLVAVCRRARADEMAISIGFVDAAHAGPEFMVAYPGSRKGSLFTAVGSIPFVGRHHLCRVGSVLQQIICARLAALDDVL